MSCRKDGLFCVERAPRYFAHYLHHWHQSTKSQNNARVSPSMFLGIKPCIVSSTSYMYRLWAHNLLWDEPKPTPPRPKYKSITNSCAKEPIQNAMRTSLSSQRAGSVPTIAIIQQQSAIAYISRYDVGGRR